jgi:hypothetical protein
VDGEVRGNGGKRRVKDMDEEWSIRGLLNCSHTWNSPSITK